MILYKEIKDNASISHLNGIYSHISKDSVIIGGKAIDIALGRRISMDIDIIGTKYSNSRRIEITKSNSIEEHFRNATLSIEQVGVYRWSNRYFLIYTPDFQATVDTGVIKILTQQLTAREKVRAIFKAVIYDMILNKAIDITQDEALAEARLIARYASRLKAIDKAKYEAFLRHLRYSDN